MIKQKLYIYIERERELNWTTQVEITEEQSLPLQR